MKDYIKFVKDKFNNEPAQTPLGEPQIWLDLKSGRSIEITLESAGLLEEKYYYSVNLHCSEDEFEKGEYADTIGIMKTLTAKNLTDAATELGVLLESYGEELCSSSFRSSNHISSLCF